MKKFIIVNKRIPMKTFRYWMKVKFFLNECSERKIYNEHNNAQFGKSSDMNAEQRYLQPSKRNRSRLFNQNFQLSNSKNNCKIFQVLTILFTYQFNLIVMTPDHMIFSEEITSSRNGNQAAKLLKDNIPLSAERTDCNMNLLLSPKMICSFSHISEKPILEQKEQKNNDFIQELDQPTAAVQFKQITYGQLLRSLFNYADEEEEEDVRRIQKKASIHHEYRLYQKTDLIIKNLKPIEIGENKNVNSTPEDQENPDINDSFNDFNDNKVVKGGGNRQAKNLAPRFIRSQEKLDEESETSSKKEPSTDFQSNTPTKKSELQQEQKQKQQQEQQNIRHVYLQANKSLHAREQEIGNDDKIIDLLEDENLQLSPAEIEEDEDIRRLMKKSTFQYDLNIQRKAKLIYKNLFKVNYDENQKNQEEIEEVSMDDEDSHQADPNKSNQCDIDDSILSVDDFKKQISVPENKQFEGFERTKTLKQPQQDKNDQEMKLKNVLQPHQQQSSPAQQSPNDPHRKMSDISASKQIQEIINFRAQNLMKGQTIELSNNLNETKNNSSLQNNISQDLKLFNRGSSTINSQIVDTLINNKKQQSETNKLVHNIANDVIKEDENIYIEEDEESQTTAKDSLTQKTNTKKVNSYFDNIPLNEDKQIINETVAQNLQAEEKSEKKQEYNTPDKDISEEKVANDKQTEINYNEDQTLYQNIDFWRQQNEMNLYLYDNSPYDTPSEKKINEQYENIVYDSQEQDVSIQNKSILDGSQQIINPQVEDQILKPSLFSKQRSENMQSDLLNLDEQEEINDKNKQN